MKKPYILAALFLATAVQAASKSDQPITVLTPENSEVLVTAQKELETVEARKISTHVIQDPFLTVSDRWKDAANRIREMHERGEIKKNVPIEELLRTESDEPVATAPEFTAPRQTHVITPGAPVQVPRTLQDAATLKASEYNPELAVVEAERPQTPGLMTLFPAAPPDAETEQASAEVAAPQAGDGVVPFKALEPNTWKPAWEAYVASNAYARYAPGAVIAFLAALILGSRKRGPVKIRK